MNRSNKGFGLTGVFATVVILIVAAIVSASANSGSIDEQKTSTTQNSKN
jgi:hypothetical protein